MRSDQSILNNAKQALSHIWGWTDGYWYPLTNIHRKDVLALSCLKLEKLLPEENFEEFVLSFYINVRTYEFTEHDGDNILKTLEGFGYWHSELWLVDSDLKSLIYWSHEGTLTLAGTDLIESFKDYFPKWYLTLWN